MIGYCMGGGFALLLAPGHGFDAASVNYGMLPRDAATVHPGVAATMRGAAGPDAALPRFFAVLNLVAGPLMGTGSAEPQAADARRRIIAFFDRHLAAAQ